jgi:hypothetical protein
VAIAAIKGDRTIAQLDSLAKERHQVAAFRKIQALGKSGRH